MLCCASLGTRDCVSARITVRCRSTKLGRFRADALVEGRVIVEIKASQLQISADQKQLLNYLRATAMEASRHTRDLVVSHPNELRPLPLDALRLFLHRTRQPSINPIAHRGEIRVHDGRHVQRYELREREAADDRDA